MLENGVDLRLIAGMMTELRSRGRWVDRPGRYMIAIVGGTLGVLLLFVAFALLARAAA